MFKLRVTVLFIFMALTSVMYWWASDPHSFLILAMTIPAFVIGVGLELSKKRKAEKVV